MVFDLKSIALCALLILALDIPWLYMTSGWAGSMIGSIQGGPIKMRLWPAAIVYVALGIILQFPKSLLEAAILGTSVYAVYDFTNYSTITKYQLPFAVADSLWGGTLAAIAWTVKGRLKI
jgi:uncharacterized membrane protein